MPRRIEGKTLPEFVFRDLGAVVSLSDCDAYGTPGHIGFFKGGVIRGRTAQLRRTPHYLHDQRALHGSGKAALMWAAEQVNGFVQPKILLT